MVPYSLLDYLLTLEMLAFGVLYLTIAAYIIISTSFLYIKFSVKKQTSLSLVLCVVPRV